MTTIFDRLKSTEGRLSRQGYLLGFIAPVLVMAALTAAMIVGWLDFLPVGVINLMALGWVILLFVMGDAMNIRRYHDIGNSGRLYRLGRPMVIGMPILAFVIDFFIPAQMASMGDRTATLHMISEMISPTMSPITIALLVIPAAAVMFNFFYLIAMPGQPGPNEFGPPPGLTDTPGVAKAWAENMPSAGDDPVKRALADYQARQAKAAQAARPMSGQPAAAAGFGKKRR
jgi:uncharacterized membrane protein YhaH (DUF805 family)